MVRFYNSVVAAIPFFFFMLFLICSTSAARPTPATRPTLIDTDTSKTDLHTTQHYSFFDGRPRWSRPKPMNLSYAFSTNHTIHYLTPKQLESAFASAFARWAAVIPVSFHLTNDYDKADITIGFYRDGDGDSLKGALASAFAPPDGRIHLNTDVRWAVDFKKEKSKWAYDVESAAVHEIGHALGLDHSLVEGAIMYPSLNPRTKKVNLLMDDVEGAQASYGANPNFNISDLNTNTNTNTNTSTSTSRAFMLTTKSSSKYHLLLLMMLFIFI